MKTRSLSRGFIFDLCIRVQFWKAMKLNGDVARRVSKKLISLSILTFCERLCIIELENRAWFSAPLTNMRNISSWKSRASIRGSS